MISISILTVHFEEVVAVLGTLARGGQASEHVDVGYVEGSRQQVTCHPHKLVQGNLYNVTDIIFVYF